MQGYGPPKDAPATIENSANLFVRVLPIAQKIAEQDVPARVPERIFATGKSR
jgi:hypothetical protein